MEQSINHQQKGCCPHCHARLVAETKYGRKAKLPPIEVGVFKKTMWYNSNQAAEALGISRDTLRKIRTNGKLKIHINRTSKRIEYLGSELEAYYTRKSHI